MSERWPEVRLGAVATRVTEKNGTLTDKVFTVSAEHGLLDQEEFFNKRVASKNLAGYSIVRPGMLVYNKSYSAGAPYGVITRNQHKNTGVVSPLYIVFEPIEDKVSGAFLELACNSPLFQESLQQYIKEGGRAHGGISVSLTDFFECTLPLPSLAEQKRIVDVVGSVDVYTAALQRQAADARTARNAVLHELLTSGGDDWTETTLGNIAEYVNGFPFRPEDLGEQGTPVIRIKQLLDPTETCDKTLVNAPDRCVLKAGDIVFSWSGTLAVRVWNRGRAFLNQHLFRVVEKDGVMHEWLPLVLDHAIHDLSEMAHGTTMKHVTKQTLLPHTILLPPLSEQKRIVEIVTAMDDVVYTTEQAIVHAQLLRSGLLLDLLSGEHAIPESYDRLLGAA